MFLPTWFSSRFQYMMCFDPLYCHKNVQVIPMCYKNVIFIFLIQFCHKISTNIFCWRFLLQAPQTRQRRLVNQNKQQMLVEILWQNWIQKNLNNNFVTQWNHSKPLLNERTEKNTSYITIWKRRKRKKNTLGHNITSHQNIYHFYNIENCWIVDFLLLYFFSIWLRFFLFNEIIPIFQRPFFGSPLGKLLEFG